MNGLPPLLRLLRPQQWTKNLAAFAGVIFGGRITEPGSIALDLMVAIVFTAASSATYVFNDLRDVEYDRQHYFEAIFRTYTSSAVILAMAQSRLYTDRTTYHVSIMANPRQVQDSSKLEHLKPSNLTGEEHAAWIELFLLPSFIL